MSNKMSLQWHKDNLKNFENHTQRSRVIAEDAVKNVERMEREIQFTKEQIIMAKKRHMDGFDEERFLKPKV